MDIVALLNALTAQAGLTQETLAEELEVGQSSISRMKNRKQEPSFALGLRVINLAHTHGLLTGMFGASNNVPFVRLRGRMVANDIVEVASDGQKVELASIPMSVPEGCFAIVTDVDGTIWRARKGDLIIAGPSISDPSKFLDVEGLIVLRDGRCFYGHLSEGRDPGRYTIVGQHNRMIHNVDVQEVGPFLSVFAANRWRSLG